VGAIVGAILGAIVGAVVGVIVGAVVWPLQRARVEPSPCSSLSAICCHKQARACAWLVAWVNPQH